MIRHEVLQQAKPRLNHANNAISGILTACRIPKDYFITKGKGESNITIHAGSYHLALRDAGIEMCNIMTYSSILPGIAQEIEKPECLTHGSVMETIMACATSEQGVRATAGIIFGMLYDRITGRKYGGLVCEYNGSMSEEEVRKQLRQSLEELYANGYDGNYDLMDIKVITESFIPRKRFGTALVALCFTDYLFPVIGTQPLGI
ncbi:TPA: arginine decarboxylase [Candidatus Woesearchaeota archaeon]|nr:arginine decarboxylase [Candidatus Woesearchaeota archaeon]HII69287.1 arginine decarboxylase [Candidatus Woesearchaeota archaeon]